MRAARIISQLTFFVLFVYLFLMAAYPYENFLPSDLFLRLDPLIAIITFLSIRKVITGLIFSFIILGLSIVLGRYFCGWICPLGTMIDIFDKLTSHLKKIKINLPEHIRKWKFIILIVLLVSAIFSLSLVSYFDPLIISARTFTTVFYPVFVYFADEILGFLISHDIFQDQTLFVYDFLRETILPLELLSFKQSIIFFIIFISILLSGRIEKRFWCRYLCPLGALFAVATSLRITKGISKRENCTLCGKCQSACKMGIIVNHSKFHTQFECIECMNCIKVCPSKSIFYSFKFGSNSEKLDLSKREFVGSLIISFISIGVIKTGFSDRNISGKIVRPPGSLIEKEFLKRCIRCLKCVKICSSTGKCLQPALFESGFEGIWSPVVNARYGYCEYNCNLCSQICPTGAIYPLDILKKQKTRIGTAYFDKNKCIPWYRGENCLVCEEHCPVPQKAIRFDTRQFKNADGTFRKVKYPYIDENLCIGCGICVTKCPVEGVAGVFLTNAKQQRTC